MTSRASLPVRLWAACALAVAAVLAVPATAAMPPLALVFAERSTVPVDVSSVEVRIADATPTTYPFVGHRAPIPYDQAIKAWAAQRFTPTGGSVNTLRVTLQRGSIAEKLLPVTKGVAGWFKKEQNAEYTGTLEVEIAIVDPSGQILGVCDGKSWASQTVREDATSTDRENAWMAIVKTTFDNLDQEILPRMRQVMPTYVR